MPRYITLERRHAGKPTIQAFGKTWAVSDFIGTILPTDAGKRVYLVGDILQAENEDQRRAREDNV